MNTQYFRKNIEYAQIIDLKSLVDFDEGKVVGQTLVQGDPLSISVFAVDKDEQLNFQPSTGDEMIYVMDGTMKATIWGEEYYLNEGEAIVAPANIPHTFKAVKPLKVLSTIVSP
ncbi:MAG: cupin domain-containing protein [Syntrophomonadaceae bacterium]|nr:cupin domain-containing protein [Syntrophomonadaceae bacterium]